MAAPLLVVDPTRQEVSYDGSVASLAGPFAELLTKALLTMLPAEKMEMMAPATTRGYTLTHISQADYDLLVQTIQQINQTLGQEVLRTNFRARQPEDPLQAKILLADKQIVKGVMVATS